MIALLGLLLPTVFTPAGAADDPVQVSFDLRGCNNDGSPVIALPDGNGDFLCPDTEYVNGNLDKNWSELDLVPHRVTTVNNGDDQTYSFAVAGDYTHAAGDYPNRVGWDFISELELNTDLSDAACNDAVNGLLTITDSGDGVGGADQTIYRVVTITQAADLKCVYDYYQRLALGARNFSGASLQSNLWAQDLGNFGQERLSIPVNEIAPQKLTKDMTASRDSDHIWSITKGATPDHVDFADTCLPGAPLSAQVAITVEWTKLPASPSGDIDVVTHVYAENPATRTITVTATDQIRSGTTVLETVVGDPVDVPANRKLLVLTHQTTVPAGTTDLNDVATAAYTDLVTGAPILGTTTAAATATVQSSGVVTNASAVITDVEAITGSGLSYAVDSVTGASGSFNAAGDTWTSDSQSSSGSVTFNKTITASAGTSGTGVLTDTATLNGSDGFTTSAGASVDIDFDASVSLTIDKTISTVLGAGDANQTFTFDVTGPGGYSSSPTITFGPGEGGALDTNSVTLTGLVPGSYNVSERDLAPWEHQEPVTQAITLPSCGETVAIDNTFAPAQAQVQKVTVPAGTESGWIFDLMSGGQVIATATTTGTGFVNFGVDLPEGAYTVVEHNQTGYDQTGASAGCTFSVNYPADADRTFSCTYTNTRRGSITVAKVTQPTTSTEKFTFTGDVGGSLGNGESSTIEVAPGTYTSTEATKAGWDLIDITCSDSNSSGVTATGVATFVVAAGENVTCTFTNRQRGGAQVIKTVSGQVPTGSTGFTFQLRQGATPSLNGTTLESGVANGANGGIISFTTMLVPGQTYQLCEIVMPGWSTTLGTFVPDSFIPPDGSVPNPNVDNSILCVNFTVGAGEIRAFAVNNTPPPGGRALTIGFWKNWASCSGSSGKQRGVLDEVLASFPIASGQTTHGVLIGDLYVDTCQEAVSLLNKSALNGKKLASDPAFNLAAQLMATQLNFQAGAGKCAAVVTAVNQAQALLDQIGFNGSGTYKSISKANVTLANQLANTLDRYNNNLLC